MAGVHTIADLKDRCRIDAETGCWVWAGGRAGLNRMQPSIRIPQTGKSASVGGLFSLHFGHPPKGQFWIARCRNPMCCRPHKDHRTMGTRSEQMSSSAPARTLEQRAKIARGRTSGSRLAPADVDLIRSGAVTSREAADRWGITVSYAWAIRVGKARAFCAAPVPGASVFTWRPGR